ncbi:MAG: helicase-related protein, partial [Pseudomonadota bacterium]
SGFQARSIHGNKSQNQRDRAIAAFRNGEVRILVATDVAARGIDIPGVTHVYNYDLPEVPDAYVHRIGRTARAGAAGEAVALCAAHELHLLRAIEKLMGIPVRVASGEQPEAAEKQADKPRKGRRRRPNRSRKDTSGNSGGKQAKAAKPNRHRPPHANSNTNKPAHRRNRRSGRRRAA